MPTGVFLRLAPVALNGVELAMELGQEEAEVALHLKTERHPVTAGS